MPRVLTIFFLFLISNAFGSPGSLLKKIQEYLEVTNPCTLSVSLSAGDVIKYEGCEPENWDVLEIIMKRHYRFKVQVGIMNDKILAKPYPEKINNECYGQGCCYQAYGYHNREYENLFFFEGGHCKDFDQTRMIDISDLLSAEAFSKILLELKHRKAL